MTREEGEGEEEENGELGRVGRDRKPRIQSRRPGQIQVGVIDD